MGRRLLLVMQDNPNIPLSQLVNKHEINQSYKVKILKESTENDSDRIIPF